MHKVIWRQQAENDLIKIIEYIWQDSPERAVTFAQEIQARTGRLWEQPELYRVGRMRGTREMVAHPNYIVIYRIQDDTVEILRVKNTAQQWP
ncbi:MAG: type II toxin-antitoxin system RelE/ParE family toxin [Burkholderiaceae bacterium]